MGGEEDSACGVNGRVVATKDERTAFEDEFDKVYMIWGKGREGTVAGANTSATKCLG
jgi:hypothetical protein